MVYRPCDPYTLCGISNCFRLLSRTQRQIAHALLTRPPLSVLLHSVRLECVMHAASVHPEPGSNSLKNGYIFAPSRKRLHTFLRVAYSSFSYFFEFLNVFLNEIPSHFSVLWISVVQFSKTKLPPRLFRRDFYILPRSYPFVKSFSKTFLSFLKKVAGRSRTWGAAFTAVEPVYQTAAGLSRGF